MGRAERTGTKAASEHARSVHENAAPRVANGAGVIVLPVSVLTKICIPPRSRSTRCRVDLPRASCASKPKPEGKYHAQTASQMLTTRRCFMRDATISPPPGLVDVGTARKGSRDLRPCDQGSSSRAALRLPLLLDVVVAQRPPVLELLPGEDQALLVGRDALLVLRASTDNHRVRRLLYLTKLFPQCSIPQA